MKIGYILHAFPALSETFILNEILALEKLGTQIAVFRLFRPKDGVQHAQVKSLCASVWTMPENRWAKAMCLGNALLYFARTQPRKLVQFFRIVRRHLHGKEEDQLETRPLWVWALLVGHAVVQEGVTHIHAHMAGMSTTVAWLASQLTGRPFSFTTHAVDLFVQPHLLREKALGAQFVVTISEYNKRYLLEQVPELDAEKIHVIHCGIEVERLPQKCSERNGPFTLLSVGRLIEKKGHRNLIEACAALKRQGVSFQCRIIGEGPLREELQQQIEAHGLEEVELVGAMPQEKVLEMLAESDVFVLPCVETPQGDRDGIPVALMEAMGMGLPTISTRVSGIPELIEHDQNGLLVPPGQVEALVEAIHRFRTDPALGERCGNAAIQKVRQEFDVTANASQLADLLHEHS